MHRPCQANLPSHVPSCLTPSSITSVAMLQLCKPLPCKPESCTNSPPCATCKRLVPQLLHTQPTNLHVAQDLYSRPFPCGSPASRERLASSNLPARPRQVPSRPPHTSTASSITSKLAHLYVLSYPACTCPQYAARPVTFTYARCSPLAHLEPARSQLSPAAAYLPSSCQPTFTPHPCRHFTSKQL